MQLTVMAHEYGVYKIRLPVENIEIENAFFREVVEQSLVA